MPTEQVVLSSVTFTPVPALVRETGLLGWVSFAVNDLFVFDGVAVRVSLDGRRYLAYPKRRDRHGREHAVVKPMSAAVADAIEQQVFELIHLPGEVA